MCYILDNIPLFVKYAWPCLYSFCPIQGPHNIYSVISINPMMPAQELEAEENLCSFSQKTNYIVDWTERPINKYLNELHKHSILEELEDDVPRRPAAKKTSALLRDVSEKYNLRKYENKLEIINQIEYPLIHQNMLGSEDYYTLPKNSATLESIRSPSIKRKGSLKSGPYCVVGVEFLNRKLQLFQRKHTESQKNINARSQGTRSKYTPRSLNLRRASKPNDSPQKKIVLNMEELEQIKQMITKNSRRYSVPHSHELSHLPQLKP